MKMHSGISQIRMNTKFFADVASLVYYVWNELKQLVYKGQKEHFQAFGFLRQRTRNVWRLLSREDSEVATDWWKKDEFRT
jgi:hypothetical protein